MRRKIYWDVWIPRILAAIALITGIVLEILGYEAVVEGIVVAFGLFIIAQLGTGIRRLESRIGRMEKGLENLGTELRTELKEIREGINKILEGTNKILEGINKIVEELRKR